MYVSNCSCYFLVFFYTFLYYSNWLQRGVKRKRGSVSKIYFNKLVDCHVIVALLNFAATTAATGILLSVFTYIK